MTAHVITAPDPTTPGAGAAPVADPRSPWLRLSAAFTDAVTDLTDREDLTVRCAPGLGCGAPGCFVPSLATVELDGTHLGQRPATCDPSRPSDRERYPALWGVLVHEAAHATHTRWTPPGGAPAAAVDAALVLEESRIEVAQIRRRPIDRPWLRASATRLVLADFTAPPANGPGTAAASSAAPGSAPPPGPAGAVPTAAMTPWDAARAAALLLARTDAGILEHAETAALRATITDVLGPTRLSALAALWHIAHVTSDTDAETMIDLGRRWCRIVGAAPDRPAPTPPPGTPGAAGEPSPLAEAIGAALTAVETATATATAARASGGADPAAVRADERQQERAAQQAAEHAARRVFSASTAPTGRRGATAITGTRVPRPEEQAAARRLARRLRSAAHRDRVATTSTSPTPPGRLSMRGAMAADAQRAAGATPTAEPFTRTTRRHVPAPPLRIGIACDVSGSMHALAAPVASAAWILARAAAHVPDAVAATVIFGAIVRPVTRPGQTPTRVTEFTARDSREDFVEAVDALDAALDLTRPGAARLLVIVSDGKFKDPQPVIGQQRIDRLTAAGCAVLWLALSDDADAMDGTHLVPLPGPATAADTIGAAATRALHNA
ncbi:hypothetical protein [Actinomadura sp. 9N407]|uniref:hypothetical protein n=1 Tax=Actinomadura sp. 9N407 TaxID=3375154 RepID=UPI0037A9DA2F